MTAGVYTTTVDILGGASGTDEWGYPTDSEGISLAGIPARITERRVTVATEASPQAVTVHYYTGRVPAGTPVTADDRLRDTADGALYSIDYVSRPTNPAIPADVRLDLRRVT